MSKKISVFGLGYVGTVTAACLAQNKHRVIGVDVAEEKINLINAGRSPIIERDIDQVVAEGVAKGLLQATADVAHAVHASDLAIVCVGTPSSENNSLDTRFVEQVTAQIGVALKDQNKDGFLFVLRSTVLPGTTARTVIPLLERTSGRTAGNGYDVAFHPEFLREGSSVKDFHHPPKIVIGERAPGTARALKELYDGTKAPVFATTIEIAELIKYSANAFHAVKITFANEVGSLCQRLGIDAHEVMDMFCADTQLNISRAYLRPGFAFGGSCLPKDVRALIYHARHGDLELPLLESLLASNHEQIERVFRRIERHRPALVGMYGLAFKPGTDDLRESPLVTLAERLLGKGMVLRIFDPNVETSRLVGGNRAYVEQRLPHLSRQLVSCAETLAECDIIVVGHPMHDDSQMDHWLEAGRHVLDLTGATKRRTHPSYEGLYW
jgi:GDP-mannose 6-dehydrogenase